MIIIEDKILIGTLADIYFKPHNIQGFPKPPGFSVADDIEDGEPFSHLITESLFL